MNKTPTNADTAISPAPFRSPDMIVKPEWIDYNGHLNMAYYNVLFDHAVDHTFLPLGLGPDYVKTRNMSFFTAEAHLTYKRELAVDTKVYVESRVIDADEKRLHLLQELFHAEEGWVSAVSQTMTLHVDMATRRVAPWPDDVRAKVMAARDAHSQLPPHPLIGASIAIRKK